MPEGLGGKESYEPGETAPSGGSPVDHGNEDLNAHQEAGSDEWRRPLGSEAPPPKKEDGDSDDTGFGV